MRLDELLTAYSEGWTLARMPAVDRNVLRLGLWELLYADDVPDAVAVSEAMALVRDLSTDDSPQFVNGVLGNLQRNKASLSKPLIRVLTWTWTSRTRPSGPAARPTHSEWLDHAIRAGLVAYGVVHLLIAWLALPARLR